MRREGSSSRRSGSKNRVRFDANVVARSPCCRRNASTLSSSNRLSCRDAVENPAKPSRRATSKARNPMTLENAALRVLDLGHASALGDPANRVTSVTPEMKQLARDILKGRSPKPCTCEQKKRICDCGRLLQCGVNSKRERSVSRDSSPPPSAEAIQESTRDAYCTPFRCVPACGREASPPPSETEQIHCVEDAGQTPFCRSARLVYGSPSPSNRRSRHITFADGANRSSSSQQSVKRDSCKRRNSRNLSSCKRSVKRRSRSDSRPRESNEFVSITLTRRELNALIYNLHHRSAEYVTIVLKRSRVSSGAKTSQNSHDCC